MDLGCIAPHDDRPALQRRRVGLPRRRLRERRHRHGAALRHRAVRHPEGHVGLRRRRGRVERAGDAAARVQQRKKLTRCAQLEARVRCARGRAGGAAAGAVFACGARAACSSGAQLQRWG